MRRRGRPPVGPALVDRLDGSPQAKTRLRVILQVLGGERTVPEACAQLGIERSRFHELREAVLQEALAALEPRLRGRPPRQASPEEAQVAALEDQVQELKVDLRAAQVREELALVMPHVVHKPQSTPHARGGEKGGPRNAAP